MDIFSGNGFTLSYNRQLDNLSPQFVNNIKINQLAALPTLEISSKVNSYETYDNEYSSKLLAEQQVAPISIVVNYIPDDSTHQFLDAAAESGEEFQLVLKYIDSSAAITYAIVNGVISGTSTNGDKDTVVSKTYSFETTELMVRAANSDTIAPLYEGDYGVGSNGEFIPQYEAQPPTGNSFVKIPASQPGNPTGSDMMGIGLVNDGTYSSIAITRSGSLSLFAKNQSTAWTRILTATQIAGQYVPLTSTVNGKSLSGNIALNSTDTGSLAIVNNLSDVTNKTTARTNLEVYSSGEVDAKLSTINQSITTTNSNVSDIQNDITIINANVNDLGTEIDSFKTSTNDAIGTLGSDITEVKNDYVPKTTTVNGQSLSNNVTITAEDIDALTLTGNDLVLPGDITSPVFDGSLKEYIDNATPVIDTYTRAEADDKFVDKTTTVNGHALSDNVTVTKADIGLGNVTNDAQLKLSSNLSDVPDKSAARTNLAVDRLEQQYSTETRIYSDVNKTNRLTIQDGGTWGLYSDNTTGWVALAIEQGGTSARTLDGARANLQIDRLTQHADFTILTGPIPGGPRMVLYKTGAIGFQTSDGINIGLPVGAGGTGAMTIAGARSNLQIDRINQGPSFTSITAPAGSDGSVNYIDIRSDNNSWGAYKAGVGPIPLAIGNGGTGTTSVMGLNEALGMKWLPSTDPKVLEYIDWLGIGMSPSETMVRIGLRTIEIQGIIRSITNIPFRLKKGLPGLPNFRMPYSPATYADPNGNMGLCYLRSVAGAATNFDFVVDGTQTAIAWYMVNCTIRFIEDGAN